MAASAARSGSCPSDRRSQQYAPATPDRAPVGAADQIVRDQAEVGTVRSEEQRALGHIVGQVGYRGFREFERNAVRDIRPVRAAPPARPPRGQIRRDECALCRPVDDPALSRELVERRDHGSALYAERLRQRAASRQPIAGLQPAAAHIRGDRARDLQEQRQPALPLELDREIPARHRAPQ